MRAQGWGQGRDVPNIRIPSAVWRMNFEVRHETKAPLTVENRAPRQRLLLCQASRCQEDAPHRVPLSSSARVFCFEPLKLGLHLNRPGENADAQGARQRKGQHKEVPGWGVKVIRLATCHPPVQASMGSLNERHPLVQTRWCGLTFFGRFPWREPHAG